MIRVVRISFSKQQKEKSVCASGAALRLRFISAIFSKLLNTCVRPLYSSCKSLALAVVCRALRGGSASNMEDVTKYIGGMAEKNDVSVPVDDFPAGS